jgi:hypothetical protein
MVSIHLAETGISAAENSIAELLLLSHSWLISQVLNQVIQEAGRIIQGAPPVPVKRVIDPFC